ncbi:hypothetical protein ABZ851_18435 [Streptomyces sp. NPDC047049]|uniref:hypothetical protein n=1 Tax=Streptomyces sp. NPDC047049 TaxID=3156688 RepID=UPI0034084405
MAAALFGAVVVVVGDDCPGAHQAVVLVFEDVAVVDVRRREFCAAVRIDAIVSVGGVNS